MIYSTWMHWVIFALGTTNFLLAILIFASCRIIPAFHLTKGLMAHKTYQKFFRHHALYWNLFWVSVSVHAVLATWRAGLPW